jgi:hypothetical protein
MLILRRWLLVCWVGSSGLVSALPLIGVDFSNGAGTSDPTPDDLNPDDTVTVSGWTLPGLTGGIIQGDANADAGRADAPVVKFDGVVGPGTEPAVGSAPPTDGIHQLTITVGVIPLDLKKISFSFSKATGGSNARWLAFRTSLDSGLIFSQQGQARPSFEKIEIILDDAKYEGLTNQSIDLIWYCGGEGSGDIDIDSIVIDGFLGGDSDGDGMNDSFEQLIIDADPDDALATIADVRPEDDFDNDLLSNLEEFERLTSPIDDDSDDDGLRDGVESGDGTFQDLASDTGTDPLDPDTDGDGLLDGVESNDGTFNGAEETGSDPLDENSDGDDFRDGAEVLIHGTDPNKAASEPRVVTEVLFLDGDGSGTLGADEVAVSLLQDKYGISRVSVRAAVEVLAGTELAYDLLVLSSTPGSQDIRGKFQDSPVPLVCWEEAVIDNGAGEFGGSTVVMTKSVTTSQMTLLSHPLTEGLPAVIELYAGGAQETTSTPAVYGALAVVGSAANGNAGGADITGQAMVIVIEAGDEVDPGTGTLGGVAPARRVLLPWTDNSLGGLTEDGMTLFSNALDWALGTPAVPAGGGEITEIEVVESGFPVNRVVTLKFTSQVGRDYEVLSATGLEDFAHEGAELIVRLSGQEGITTAVLDFSVLGLPSGDPKRFFVVREVGP